jgi:hypothetical protein
MKDILGDISIRGLFADWDIIKDKVAPFSNRLATHFMRIKVKISLYSTLFAEMGYDLRNTPPRYLLPQLSIPLNSRQTPPNGKRHLVAPIAG